jgi:NAD(P)-dependent dehydrogenase (short-subunit alcohol dehydrogenase family)
MLKSKVAVVTGSTSGIGLGIARALGAAGADLMINGFGEAAEIDKLRREIAGPTAYAWLLAAPICPSQPMPRG